MNEWLRNTARSYLALSYIRSKQFPVPFPDRFRKVLSSKLMTVGRGSLRGVRLISVKVELHYGCCYCYSSHHFTPTGKWFSTGYWREQVKQQAYSSSLFVLWHRGVYPAPQRHGSLLWAVARSHGGGQGMAAYWHPRCCPLNTLGERKAGSLLGWHYFESWERSLIYWEQQAYFGRLLSLCVWCFHILGVSFPLFTLMPVNPNKLSSSWTIKARSLDFFYQNTSS